MKTFFKKIQNICNISCGSLAMLTAYLLTRKFGGLSAMTDASGFFPENFSSYLVASFPVHSLGIVSGILLLLSLGLISQDTLRSRSTIVALLWSAGLFAAALPGCFAPGNDWDFAIAELANIAGIGAWVLAINNLIHFDARWGKRLAGAFIVGVLLTCCSGYWQYFYGFSEMREFVAEQQQRGIAVPQALINKLADPRITGTMASSNALAGVLLLALLPTLFFAVKAGRKFEPVRISQLLFCTFSTVLLGGALILSRSRSTFICLLGAAAAAFFSAPQIKKKWKLAGALLFLCIAAAGAVYIQHFGRGTASITERIDYLNSSAVLTLKHPVTGAGWGGFFYHHMQHKFSSTDESARDPHNMVAAFASQSGAAAGVIAAAALLLPLIFLWKERFNSWKGAVFWSGTLFTLHTLMDSDFHVPSIPFAMLMLYLPVLDETSDKVPAVSKHVDVPLTALAALIFSLLSLGGNIFFVCGEKYFSDLGEKLQPSSVEQSQRWAFVSVESLAEKAQKYRPFNAMIPEMLGDWHLNCGELDKAAEYYSISQRLNSRRPSIYRRLSALAYRKGNTEQAKALLDHARKLFPKNRRYHWEDRENFSRLFSQAPASVK